MGFEAESGTGGGGGTIGGSGTLNYVSKFTPNGTTLGDSLLFDNGTSIQQRFSPTVYLSTTVDSFGATTIGAVGSESAYGFQYTSPTGAGNFLLTETVSGRFISIKPIGLGGSNASMYVSGNALTFFTNNGQWNFERITAGAVSFTTNNRSFVLSATSGPDFFITPMGNVAIGNVALATSATDGFLHIPISNGTPTGVPTNITGVAPIEIDYANNAFYFYNAEWRRISPETQTEMLFSFIDWNYSHHYKTLTANDVFTFNNAANAKTIIVAITNTASNYTVTWPSGVLWTGGTEPTQTIGAKTDIYTLTQINGVIYGSYVQDLS